MGQSLSLEAFRGFLKCQKIMGSEDFKKKPQKTLPFITISRQYGAGGHTVAHELKKRLSETWNKSGCPWTVMDRELVQTVLEEHGLSQEVGAYLTERRVSEIRDIVEELCGLHPPTFSLVRKTSETLLHLAGLGHTVLIGLGGAVVTRSLKGGLHVRLMGSANTRARHASEYYGISSKEAFENLRREDKNRRDYLKQHFGEDIDNPLLYDLVINTDQVAYPEAALLIANQAEALYHRLNPDAAS